MNESIALRARKGLIPLAALATILVALLVGARPAAAAAACAAAENAKAEVAQLHVASKLQGIDERGAVDTDDGGIIVTPQVITCTPYDGFHITSSANCQARVAYLKKVAPDFKSWKCQRSYMPGCPTGYYYWMVMVGTNY
ncbi:hypothetical protein [Cellulosimicrobium funkei]|uniref:Uncharacterized protein n=1 Tax=Cellulosimicrobium funkei TaxID=264251 RepID=A0A4Y8QXL2_9MICO|nr:hypothetical protein [Cellulosimicrobium funkei]TFF04188.1 hypothetical protein E1O70_19050 [Cellulosimicrobium funkei]TGA67615.1 hypothetical protein EQW79_019045 [Cellulosimicrobium terreum]